MGLMRIGGNGAGIGQLDPRRPVDPVSNPYVWPPKDTAAVMNRLGMTCLPDDWPPYNSGYYVAGPPMPDCAAGELGIPGWGTQAPVNGAVLASGPSTVTLQNTSRPGSPFQVGDRWRLSITGAAPNSPVTALATQNGQSLGETPMGTTDSSGRFSLTGAMGTGEVGSWSESWNVGGEPVGDFLNFTVSERSASASGTRSSSAGGGSVSSTGGGTQPGIVDTAGEDVASEMNGDGGGLLGSNTLLLVGLAVGAFVLFKGKGVV
jgi:hypothetical protein